MERPCFPGNTHRNPANNFSWVMTDHLGDEEVLTIAGNETIARQYFSHVERKLARISQVGSNYFVWFKIRVWRSLNLFKTWRCICLKRHTFILFQKTYAQRYTFPFLGEAHCPTEFLTTMPDVAILVATWRPTTTTQNSSDSISHHQLEVAYKTFLHLSVVFKFIAKDWSEFGHSCVSQQADNILYREYTK